MATKVKADFEITLPPAAVCKALRDPKLIEWWIGKSFGLVERWEVRDLRVTPALHEFEIRVVPADVSFIPLARRKRAVETSRIEWDLVNLVQRWAYVGSAKDQIRASGKDRLLATPTGTRLEMRAKVDIAYYLAGALMEAQAKRTIKRVWRTTLEHVARTSRS